jgi:hypothetical protein
MTPLPEDRTIDDLLACARTRNRYTAYDMVAAEARLRARQAARHRPPRQRAADTVPAHTEWITPEDDRAPDADRAWWDLNAVCLLALAPTPTSTSPPSSAATSPTRPARSSSPACCT